MGGLVRLEDHGEVLFIRMTRTLLGRPIYWTGAYLVDGLLVDCGPPALARDLLRVLEGRPIRSLVITHHHEDHSGGAPWLVEQRGLVPAIHAAGLPILEQGFRIEPYRRLAWGRPRSVKAEALGEEVSSRSFRFTIIHTPGHSLDHVCLFEPDRGWLFTGDLFLAERLRYLRWDEDLQELIGSLRAVNRLPLRAVFCAHRGPVRDGPAALRRKAERLEDVRGVILDLLARGLPEAEIARRAVGREGPLTWISAGGFSARNFVRAVSRSRAEA